MAIKRRRLQPRVTEEARAGIEWLTARHNITQNSLFEAIGRKARRSNVVSAEVIAEAQRIDGKNRSRSGLPGAG